MESFDGTETEEDRRVPVYLQIQDYLEKLIASPGFGPGARVPSERALAEELGANRMTVRKAIDRLVEKGLLERNGTSGTRVPLAPRITRPIGMANSVGMARVISSTGGKPGNKLLHFEQAVANDRTAALLGVAPGADLVLLRRVWTVDGTPFCVERSILPAARVPDLAAEDLMAGQSLYALLRSRYGIEVSSAERVLGVARLSDRDARLLALEPGGAALLLRLVAFDADGRPVEYMKSVNHPDLVVFKTEKAGIEW